MCICKSRKGKLVRYELLEDDQISYKKIDPYSYFNINSKKNDVKVTVGEPNMLNPNSFENLASVLQCFSKCPKIDWYTCSGENDEKKWIFIENDGGILVPVINLISSDYRCKICNEAIYGREKFDSHLCSEAYNFGKINFCNTFFVKVL